ncbi:hypothetical protein GCM10029992_21190 [Glycomyces albus]
MSLRSRLTTAFLVVVLGPVLVGAVFVAAIMSHLSESRAQALEQSAVTNVDSTLGTICERVQASVAAVAMNYRSGGHDNAREMADLAVRRAVVDGVVFVGMDDAAGATGSGAAAPKATGSNAAPRTRPTPGARSSPSPPRPPSRTPTAPTPASPPTAWSTTAS